MSIANLLEEKLNAISGSSEILTLHALTKSGICGSSTSAKNLLKSSQIPFVRIGNKVLFAKQDVVRFLHQHVSCEVKG